MSLPIDAAMAAIKSGLNARGDIATPVRVAVFVDSSASEFLISTIREAFVPQTTSGLVRVDRLISGSMQLKSDTDVVLVLTCGSTHLQECTNELLVDGIPVVLICESTEQAPFINSDARMLGCIATTNKQKLLSDLASWILARTDKSTAFASNFSFLREVASEQIVVSTSLGNLATGALFFMPGADFPLMTAAQIAMALRLSSVYGKTLSFERAYEVVAVLLYALVMRTSARVISGQAGRADFLVKAAIGGLSTFGLGQALCAFYKCDVDYVRLNKLVSSLVKGAKSQIATRTPSPQQRVDQSE